MKKLNYALKNEKRKSTFILDGDFFLGEEKEWGEWDIFRLDIEDCDVHRIEISNFPKLILTIMNSKINELIFNNVESFPDGSQDYSFIYKSVIQKVEKGRNNNGTIELAEKTFLLDIKEKNIMFYFEKKDDDE